MIKRFIIAGAFILLAPLVLAWEGVWSPYGSPALLQTYHYLFVWQPLIAGLLAILAACIALEAILRSTQATTQATLHAAHVMARATIEAAERTVTAAGAKETARQKTRDERDRQEQIDIALDAINKLSALTKCLPAAVEEGEPQFLVTAAAALPGLSTVRLNGVEMRIRMLGAGIAKDFADIEGWVSSTIGDRDTRRDRAEFRNAAVLKREEAERLKEKIQGKLRFGA
ncbi:MAG TPA: hypothetical protein VGV37_15010 [Aliidongia sp.]|uniref:hypothetical protein n=1 Tax=Aliidongia sp. TaxID=1914230 RepID=UPI002DDD2C58|nr:hypothetical protein [Aliidongia sp.]HEV2675853.1 hypothetical protein [Aliidongia sp.]